MIHAHNLTAKMHDHATASRQAFIQRQQPRANSQQTVDIATRAGLAYLVIIALWAVSFAFANS